MEKEKESNFLLNTMYIDTKLNNLGVWWWLVRMIIRKAEKKMHEIDMGGMQVSITQASSLFFFAILYSTVLWDVKKHK